MTAKPTSGTWEKADSGTRDEVLIGVQTPNGWIPIARVDTPNGSQTGHANANLMIASPTLLSACQDALQAVEAVEQGIEVAWADFGGQLRQAIAKAKGH